MISLGMFPEFFPSGGESYLRKRFPYGEIKLREVIEYLREKFINEL